MLSTDSYEMCLQSYKTASIPENLIGALYTKVGADEYFNGTQASNLKYIYNVIQYM